MDYEQDFNSILVETDSEKVLRLAQNLDSKAFLWLMDTDVKKFDQVINKVAKVIDKNRELADKIKGGN
jgi:hypothetical protein